MHIFRKLFVLICVIILIEAHIGIDIDDDELKSIGELLVESYLRQNLFKCATMSNGVLRRIESVSITILQLIGVTTSLTLS